MRDTFYITGGTLPTTAHSYVTRDADAELFEGLQQGEFCYVLNTRQIGKSSLMVRTAHRLRAQGVRVAVLDLTAIGQNVSVQAWYNGLLTLLAEQIGLEDELEAFWLEHARLAPMQRWMQALRQVMLLQPHPVCIFVDEIDAVRSLPFPADEFFAGIRECYNRRAHDAAYTRLTFCLLGVAAPTDLIRDARTTPFNIGKRIELRDFTAEEAAPLALGLNHRGTETQRLHRETRETNHGGHGEKTKAGERREGKGESGNAPSSFLLPPSSLKDNAQQLLSRVLYWTDGHPYLTQKLCQWLVERRENALPEAGAWTAADVDGACEVLFFSRQAQLADDNLAFVRSRLLHDEAERAALLDIYRHLLGGRRLREDTTNPLHSALRLSGIVKVMNGQLRVRNRIYARVFDKQWAESSMPGEELRRQKAAYRRGVLRTVALAGGIVGALTAFAGVALQQAREAKLQAANAQKQTGIAQKQTRIAQEQADLAQQQTLLAKQKTDEAQRSTELAEENLALATSRKRKLDAALKIANSSAAQNAELARAREDTLQALKHQKHRAEVSARQARHSAQIAQIAQAHASRTANENLALAQSRKRALDAARQAQNSADLNLYNANMSLTQRELESGNVREAAQLLRDTEHSKFRHFEWDFLNRALHREQRTFLAAPSSKVWAARFLPDGRQIVTGGTDGKVRVWDRASGALIGALPDNKHYVTALACAPDGSEMAVGDSDGMVRIWDARTKQILRELRHAGTFPLHPGGVSSLAYSANGSRLVTAGGEDSALYVWNARMGNLARAFQSTPGRVRSAALSADGERVLAGTDSGCAYLWNVATGREEQCLRGHRGGVTAVAFAPNGAYVVTGSHDHEARVWDAHTGTLRHRLQKHLRNILCVAVSPDSRRVVTGGEDNLSCIWDADTGLETMRLTGHSAPIVSAAFSPDGRQVLTGSEDSTARLWDAQDDHAALTLAEPDATLTSVAYSPDSRWLAVASSKNFGRVWNARSGQPAWMLAPHDELKGYLTFLTFAPNGKYVAAACLDGTTCVWDTQSRRELQRFSCRTRVVTCVAFSPDSRYLVTGHLDGTGAIWDWRTARPITTLNSHREMQSITSIAFSPDGKTIAACGLDHSAFVWDAQTGDKRFTLAGHASHVFSVIFSPDGRQIVTAGGDHVARIWDAHTGMLVRVLQGHRDWVKSAAYSRDGRRIVTGSFDGTARLWDAQTGRELLTLPCADAVESVAFAPDGEHIATAGHAGRVKIWLATPEGAAR